MQKRFLSLAAMAALSFVLFACPGGGGNGGGQDAGLDANDIIEEPIIKVSGTASVHPNAAAWMSDAGLTVPAVEGLTLKVEEPLGAANEDPNAIFGTVVLPANGAFEVAEVDTAKVVLGIAAGIRDERDAGAPAVVRAATAIFDVQIAEGKPTADIANAKAYAVPVEFHDKLTEIVTPARIMQITGSPSIDTLIEAGFILGKIVDAQGNPVAGALIETNPADWAGKIFYPDEGLTTVTQNGTSANGLFIFVNTAADLPTTFTMTIPGKSEYKRRNAGATKNAALVLEVFPGTVAP